MIEPISEYLPCAGVNLHYMRWGEPSPGRPAAILMHGLGFVGATWTVLAQALARDYTVYAIDRRGHGRSAVTGPGEYQFSAYCQDLVAFLDALDIRDAYGIGHSSGATDLLLAAGKRPHAFQRILAVEPTAQDPTGKPDPDPTLSQLCQMLLARTRHRHASFASEESAYEHLSTRSPLRKWHPEILRAHVAHGFRESAEGGLTLCCDPGTEADMLVPIFQAMENRYPGDEFRLLAQVACPVLIASTDGSDPIYSAMAGIVTRIIPGARHHRGRDRSHFWPQECPDDFTVQVAAFANA